MDFFHSIFWKRKYKQLLISLFPLFKKIDYLQVKYFKKGQLKDHTILRYFFKDLALYFFVAFLFFFVVFFVNQILLTVENLLAKSAPFKDVMRIMWYSMPFVIAQSAPYATLIGFLLCLGGMMSNNEIMIIRAAGFSFFKILFPVAVLGILISIGSFFVNDYLLPLGTVKYNRLLREIMHSTPTVELESNTVKKLDSANIVIGTVQDKTVSDLVLIDSKDGKDRIIFAGKTSFADKTDPGVLMSLNMNDTTVISMESKKRSDFDVITSGSATLNVFDSTFLGNTSRSAREMTTRDLAKEIKRMKSDAQLMEVDKNRSNIWIMEFHKKFALPFGSIFFALLAFSVAFLIGKRNGQALGLLIGLLICVLNWAMQISGQLFVQKIGLPAFWCIWVPNFLVGGFAVIFISLLIRK